VAIANLFPGAHVYEHGNCGMPYRGSVRRRAPSLLMVCHITGNSNLPSALAEMTYSARAGSGASFPFCVNRNGTAVQGYDPVLYAPWTNGDLQSPDMSNPAIAAIASGGLNANEMSFMTVEAVGYEPGSPYTDAQVETIAKIVAWGHAKAKAKGWNLPIDAVRVVGHYQINGVTRRNCPSAGDKLALRNRIITRARALAGTSTPAQEEEMPDAAPKTWRRKTGVVTLKAGVTYNAFRLKAISSTGEPTLERFTVKLAADSRAAVAGLGHWLTSQAESACYMVTPWIYVPGRGVENLVWWSKEPSTPPAVAWDAATATGFTQAQLDAAKAAGIKQGRTEGADAVLEAAKAKASTYGAS